MKEIIKIWKKLIKYRLKEQLKDSMIQRAGSLKR
jgi:hypothetical protein